MTSKWAVFIPGNPVPAARPRVFKNGGRAYPKAYTEWTRGALARLETALKEDADVPFSGPLFSGPVRVHMMIYRQKAKTSKLDYPSGDLDNYAKGPLDALTKVGVWDDDKQVVSLVVEKYFSGEEAGIDIIIEAVADSGHGWSEV